MLCKTYNHIFKISIVYSKAIQLSNVFIYGSVNNAFCFQEMKWKLYFVLFEIHVEVFVCTFLSDFDSYTLQQSPPQEMSFFFCSKNSERVLSAEHFFWNFCMYETHLGVIKICDFFFACSKKIFWDIFFFALFQFIGKCF